MRETSRLGLLVLVGVLATSPIFAQDNLRQTQRRPTANAQATTDKAPSKMSGGVSSFNILNGLPRHLVLHHDTEVGTNKPVDVYLFVIEMQVMNSDGSAEPVGLWVYNYYAAHAQDPRNAINPHNARDCKIWFGLQTNALKNHNPKTKTWPYVEFVTDMNARVLQTNEDGAVWWSDDIECWGSTDRFPPF
jgi:hypothetical protein